MDKTNVAIIYYVPNSSLKYTSWIDGFTAALEILKEKFNISMINLFDETPDISYLNSFQFLLFKSNWNWIVDNYYKSICKEIITKTGIMISGSLPPAEENLYDILFYETPWYEQFVKKHSMAIHAFGINTEIMHPLKLEKKYDWISVGAFKPYKRYDILLNKPGRGIIIGDYPPKIKFLSKLKQRLNGKHDILTCLNKAGVTTKNFMSYEDLRNYYNLSIKAYVTAELHGGGERCVLEARACGIEVTVETDNPKLKTLLNSPIYDHKYYAKQIEYGINTVC